MEQTSDELAVEAVAGVTEAFHRVRPRSQRSKEWKSPADQDARIAKMKDGSTHLAHKAEHAVDLDTGAVVAVTLQAADLGDRTTMQETLADAGLAVADLIDREALCANMCETSSPSTITVGRGKKSHLDEHGQDQYFFRCVGSFGA